MAAERELTGRRQVYRLAGPRLLWWAWLVFAVACLAGLALHGRDHAGAVTAGLIVAATGFVYGCAQYPRVVADDTGLTVQNPLRVHAVPWPAVTRVDLGHVLQVHAAPGRVVHSWAVPSSPRAAARAELRARRAGRRGAPPPGYARLPAEARTALQGSTAEFIARQLDDRARRERDRPAAPPGAARVRWAWPAIAAMAGSLLVLALILAA